jgi:imidazole glycerol-phosphate synthase subunit HisF
MTRYSETTMFYGASPEIFENAKLLRSKQTLSERKLWKYINKNQLGVKFRRQHPISSFIADFYCHKLKLVIELNGNYHLNKDQKAQDEMRTKEMEEFGIRVMRFKNCEVDDNIDRVVMIIKQEIDRLK